MLSGSAYWGIAQIEKYVCSNNIRSMAKTEKLIMNCYICLLMQKN